MLIVLQCLIAAYVLLEAISIILYVPRISLWFKGYRKQDRLFNPKLNKFALIIPARNEGNVVIKLFESINAQNYPKDKYDIYFIVSDKNDNNIKLAKEMLNNPNVLVLENQHRKAEALDYCFKTILKSGIKYDDFIVIDADNILTPDFLLEMNNATVSGADVIVPRKRVKNWESSDKSKRNLISNCSGLTYVTVDAMGNKGKCLKNKILALCGQGMLIKYRVIEDLGGYPFRGIIEDFEISVENMKKGFKEFYYEHAEIFSEEPIKAKEFNKRRVRWVRGFAEFNIKHGKEIRQLVKKDKELKKRSDFMRNGTIPLCFIFGTNVLFLIAFTVLGVINTVKQSDMFWLYYIFAFACFLITYLELVFYALFNLSEDKDINKMTVKEKIIYVLFSPFLYMDYIWIFFVAFFSNSNYAVWQPVERLEL